MPKLIIQNWDLISYDKARIQQEEILKKIIDLKLKNRDLIPIPADKSLALVTQILPDNYLIFCEHPNVYTLGNSGAKENLLLNERELEEKGIEYFHIRRGGDITYHGPGQLIGYPILDLDQFFTDIHKYLRLLEETIIITLAEFGIIAGRVEGLTGVWVDSEDPAAARKICAIGVRCSRWVTMHGFALNINTNLSYFGHIVPCGIKDKAVTSMAAETGKSVDFQKVQTALEMNFRTIFEIQPD